MELWQVEPNAIWYTMEDLVCDYCEEKKETIIEVEEQEKYCWKCFGEHINLLWNKKNPIRIRQIIDINFSKKKSSKTKERKKSTLKIRYEVLKRDNFKCVLCGKSASEIKLEVDHIIPISNGGKTVKSNLRTLCFLCNRGKGVEND